MTALSIKIGPLFLFRRAIATSARNVVKQLVVDDGVASRGHRANIFNDGFLIVGLAFGDHPVYRSVCVQDFAGGFEDK